MLLWGAMCKRFLKLNLDNDEAEFLALRHPNAFILLFFIAKRARRIPGQADGLIIGQCHIGDYQSYGLTERQYRTAKTVLTNRNIIKIVETCRTRKKATTGTTTIGTLVQLLDSKVWDINPEPNDDRNDDRATTERRPSDEEEEEEEVYLKIYLIKKKLSPLRGFAQKFLMVFLSTSKNGNTSA